MAMAAEIAGWEEVKKADAVVDAGDEKQRLATPTAREGSASEVNISEALNQIKGKIEEKIGKKEKKKVSSGVNIGDDEEGNDDEDDEDNEDEGFGYEGEEKLGSHNNSGANSDSKSNGPGSGDDSEKGSNSPSRLASDADKSKKKIPKKSRKNRRPKTATEPGIEYQSGNSTAHSGDESSGAKSDSSSKSNSGPKSGPVTVFGSPASTEVARVLACLFEKEVEFQLIRTDTYRGKHRKPDYLKLQPSGESLTYEDGKKTLVDSRAICLHVAETFAEKGNTELLGRGTFERASMEQWLRTESQSFDPPSSRLVFYLAFAQTEGIERDEEEVQKSKKELEKVLDIYERRLNDTNYLAGDQFTLADLSHLPNTYRLMTMVPECAAMFKERPNVMKWWEAISCRPKWARVVELQKAAPALA